MNQKNLSTGSKEISLIEIIQKVWNDRKNLMKFSVLFSLLGVFLALNSPNVYEAHSTFILKTQSNRPLSGGLGSIASLAGISIGNTGGINTQISPKLYPMFVKSDPFIEILLKTSIPFEGKNISLRDYLSRTKKKSFLSSSFSIIKKYIIGLPSLVKSTFFKDQMIKTSIKNVSEIKYYTIEEEKLYLAAKALINVSMDKKDGFITLSVESLHPEVAATIAMNTQTLLQQEVINFKIKNAQETLAFTEKLYVEKKTVFEALQDQLASFRDQHQNISAGLFRNKLSRIEQEFTIISNVTQELAQKVEQARILVSEATPIFTIINPVVIPNYRSKPNRTLIVLGYTLVGLIFGLIYSLIKGPFVQIRHQILADDKDGKD